MTAILGINCSGYHSSACLLINGEIAAAITEERITRIKQDKSFPTQAIRYCCHTANISLSEVTDIFIGWNPAYYMHRSDNMLHNAMKDRGKLSYLALNELALLNNTPLNGGAQMSIRQEIETISTHWRIHFVDHHEAHAANGFFQSGFQKADALIIDGFGEVSSGFSGTITKDGIKIYAVNRTPHSLGLLYTALTDFLGFKPNGDEWKVMALASLGDPAIYYDLIRPMVKVDGLRYEVDLSFFESFLYFTPHYYSPKLVELFGEPLPCGAVLTEREYNIVAAVQRVTEETIFELLTNLYHQTGNDNLIVGGGVFMNSVVNGQLYNKTPYKDIFIGGSPDDSGVSIGSALFGSNYLLAEKTNIPRSRHNSFGKTYTNEAIEAELKQRKLRYQMIDDPAGVAAVHIWDKKIVAWFQGASEFGQRALGNRSILADSTDLHTKDLVNATIKYREFFRPFAPAVLSERQPEIFVSNTDQTSYFMEKVFPFQEDWKARVPAVVHFDGSGRLQTVKREITPLYYEMIAQFEALSDIPIVLNTSFNVNGMPLVETPGDAIDCFYQSGIDTLIIHNYMVEK